MHTVYASDIVYALSDALSIPVHEAQERLVQAFGTYDYDTREESIRHEEYPTSGH